jgi:electron transfer flavoprotein beta subunit
MKILVCISVVPDTTTKITFKDNDTTFDKSSVQYILNPYDELSLTRALEIAEQNAGTVHTITVGESDCDPIIRKALAIGAHEAYRVDAQPKNAPFVAHQIASHVKSENYDLILTGRESIDYNGGMVQGLLAELLQWPLMNVATEINYSDQEITACRDIDGGRENVKSSIPCVVSAQKDLCEPRIPNMRGIMMARSKPLNVIKAIDLPEFTEITKYELPPSKTGVKLISAENAEELIDILHNEEKLF